MFFDLVKREPIFVASVSAAIGTGKSTLMRRLEQTKMMQKYFDPLAYDIVYVQEPVDLWEKKGWLQAYYADQNKNALPFQLCVMDSHVKAVATALAPYRNSNKKTICLVERCAWDQLLFWKMQVDSGYASADVFGDETYMGNWENLSSLIPDTKLIFFAKTSDFEMTQNRLREREPNKEELYKYNQRLYQKHLDWYVSKTTSPVTIPVVELNLDTNFHTSDEKLKEIVEFMVGEIKKQSFI